MRAFLTTVAGLSTRFSKGLADQRLKCIYYKNDPKKTLLNHLLYLAREYDKLVVVGGYQFKQLEEYVNTYITQDTAKKITMIYNPEYAAHGSGWSLFKGLQELERYDDLEEILFAEGDLFVDEASFQRVVKENRDVITINCEPVEASKSVAVYFSLDGRPHYVYDTAHTALRINEPFQRIYSSAQIWKFSDPGRLFGITHSMRVSAHYDTNLVLINRYFSASAGEQKLTTLPIKTWINCNTVKDFELIQF